MSLVGEAIALADDTKHAERAYELLLPYEGLVIVVARAAACNGSVDRVLGLLAKLMGRLDDAERHQANAVEISTRMNDRPGMALSGLALAEALLERERDNDRERALEISPTSSGQRARWVRAGSPTVRWRTGSKHRGSPAWT
jgi:hypothetical protein